jgi:hypothetical protein
MGRHKSPIPHTAQLTFYVKPETRAQLMAISYFMGKKDNYSFPARQLLEEGCEEYIKKLDPHKRKDFEEILGNVWIILGNKTNPKNDDLS